MSSSQFDQILTNQPFVVVPKQDLATETVIKNRFQFFSAMLRNYAKYSHEVENLPKSEVLSRVMPLANQLVEEYQFGSKFISDLRNYIADRFQKTGAELYSDIAKDAAIESTDFDVMMRNFKESKVMDCLSPRFRMMLR